MFALPGLVSVPALTGTMGFAIEWPSLGAVFAWMLIAALIGSALGALRRRTIAPPPGREAKRVFGAPVDFRFHADDDHREAA